MGEDSFVVSLKSASFYDEVNIFQTTLMFLFDLAWKSRVRLPAYLTILFIIFDYRLSIEIRFADNEDEQLEEID